MTLLDRVQGTWPMSLPERLSSCLLVLALLGALTVPALAQAPALTSLKFSLDGKLEAPAAFFLIPQDKGYFAREGLNVDVDEGASALDAITRVASGTYDFGFADINALIRYRDQNPAAAVKAVFMVYNRPPYAIVARKSRGVTEPKQLEGKKLGAPAASSTFVEWPLFAKLNQIDTSKVTIENVGIPVRVPMLAAGQLDAVLGYSFRVYVDLKARGVPIDDIVLMQMSNYGLKLYGSAIVVNSTLATEKPEVVRGFLRAVLRGLKETVQNPPAAVDALLKRDDLTEKDVELERLRMAIRDNILTPEVRMHGYGAVDPAHLEEAIDQLVLGYTFRARPKLEDIFDATFLPPAGERRVN
jgi:NitT/TauT family transport system substrate-binding protein